MNIKINLCRISKFDCETQIKTYQHNSVCRLLRCCEHTCRSVRHLFFDVSIELSVRVFLYQFVNILVTMYQSNNSVHDIYMWCDIEDTGFWRAVSILDTFSSVCSFRSLQRMFCGNLLLWECYLVEMCQGIKLE